MTEQLPRPWHRAWWTPRRVITKAVCVIAGFSMGALIGALISART